MNRIGYCCISLGVNVGRKKKDTILVNRGMVRKTFETKGLSYVSELIIENLKDTLEVIDYNIENDIHVYRMSSDSFPWMSEYKFQDIPQFDVILKYLKLIGEKIKGNDIRVSYHPGPFNVLASENQAVVKKTINELNKHSELLDLMGLEQSHYYPINIHINTTQPTREEAANRFCDQFENLSDSCKKRLVVENDDKESQYSVKILYDLVYSKIKIPITFDQLHWELGPKDLSMKESLELALSTWKVKPLTHMASSIRKEDPKGLIRAHADYVYEKIETFGYDFDIEMESKAKDLAVLKYRQDFGLIIA